MESPIDTRFDRLSEDERKVLEALWWFRPEAYLPFPLVKLAVDVEHEAEDWDRRRVFAFLGKIVEANLLKTNVGKDDFEASYGLAREGRVGFKLPGEVSAWLVQNMAQPRQGLFREPEVGPCSKQQPADVRDRAGPNSKQQPADVRDQAGPNSKQQPADVRDRAGPTSKQQPADVRDLVGPSSEVQPLLGAIAAAPAASLAATEPVNLSQPRLQKKQCLLAAFLAAYGNDESPQNVPEKAERFLEDKLKLGIRAWGNPSLVQRRRLAEELARRIEEGVSAEMVIAAILVPNGANALHVKGLKEGLRDLLNIFFSQRSEGERQSFWRLGWPVFLCAHNVATF